MLLVNKSKKKNYKPMYSISFNVLSIIKINIVDNKYFPNHILFIKSKKTTKSHNLRPNKLNLMSLLI